MAEIALFDSRWADTVAGWAGDTEATMLWCSLPSVTSETVEAWADSRSAEAYVLREAERIVAYGEVWVDTVEQEVELSHLIVDPSQRGSGFGTQLVVCLVEQARRHYPMVALRVHSLTISRFGATAPPVSSGSAWRRKPSGTRVSRSTTCG